MEEIDKVPKSLHYFNIVMFLSVVFTAFLVYNTTHPKVDPIIVKEDLKDSKVFENIKIKAKAAYVYDLRERKVLYKKNESTQLPLASITKLMTALTAVELLPENSKIVIKNEFLREEGDSGLKVSESWKLKDLLDFSLVTSSNDGVRSVASVIGAITLNSNDYNLGRKEFVEQMNLKAKDLGLKQTYFINETGLDVGNSNGGYGSVEDVNSIMKYLIINHPNILEATKYNLLEINSSDYKHKAYNTNDYIGSIPGLFASKTGYTDLAGGNLTIAFDPSIGKPFIITVLGSTQQGRFEDVKELVIATLKYLEE